MGAFKRDVVVVITMGAYIHGVLILCGCLLSQFYGMPPMEADAAYQGCLPSCELHSRSLAIGRTGACDLEIALRGLRNLEIAHILCYAIPRLPAQSRDSENAQHNLEIAQILRLRGT